MFRSDQKDSTYEKLHDYGDQFISFLKSDAIFIPEKEEKKYISDSIVSYYYRIREDLESKIRDELAQKPELDETQIQILTDEIIKLHYNIWTNGVFVDKEEKNHDIIFINEFREIIKQSIDQVFERIPLTDEITEKLQLIAARIFLFFPHEIQNNQTSGVVIAGFGEAEIFPSIISYDIECKISNILKFRKKDYKQIDFENSASIFPFAQSEMVHTYLRGISPTIQKFYDSLIKDIIDEYPKILMDQLNIGNDLNQEKLDNLNDEIIPKIKNALEDIQKNSLTHYVDPVLETVQFLPKGELAEMAESLVNLSCLRKKISLEEETVGGPIDIALISKGDGLIWIKRKHYFTPELNQHFFINYLKK
ncbi:MAG: hypothetical protein ACLFQX_03780 [Candidatus Kapaibacterium sp.]